MVGRVFGGGHFFLVVFLMGGGLVLWYSGVLGIELLGCVGEGKRGREGGREGKTEN